MQVVVRDPTQSSQPQTQNHENHMQLVLKHAHDSFSSHHHNHHSPKSLKGRGKDSFFLVAQDLDSPDESELIRDSRKVPKNVLNQLTPAAKKKPAKPARIASFPNYPVKMDENLTDKLTFHQAFGTDFDARITPTTTQPPNFILTPPEPNAPIANFYGKSQKSQLTLSRPRKPSRPGKPSAPASQHRLPKNHPLRQVLPPSARVVGIQPLRKIALSNRGHSNSGIMTLNDFLAKYPDMEKMKRTSIVPVPVTEEKHIKMIELLTKRHHRAHSGHKGAHQAHETHHNDLDEMFKELENLISKRAERKISFIHNKSKPEQSESSTLSVRPRGGLPGPRFMPKNPEEVTSVPPKFTAPTKATTTKSTSFSPRLEFGFIPIINTTPKPTTTTASPKSHFFGGHNPHRFKFDDILHETDQLVAPRLPRQPIFNDIESNEISQDINDPFFFTTTPKPLAGVSPAASQSTKIKPGIFDMRKFFFIPANSENSANSQPISVAKPKIHQAERRVHTLVGYPPNPHAHRAFHFRG